MQLGILFLEQDEMAGGPQRSNRPCRLAVLSHFALLKLEGREDLDKFARLTAFSVSVASLRLHLCSGI
jgi:hypothetical protein